MVKKTSALETAPKPRRGRKQVAPVMPPSTLAAARGERREEVINAFISSGKTPDAAALSPVSDPTPEPGLPAPPEPEPSAVIEKASARPRRGKEAPSSKAPFDLPLRERKAIPLASGGEVLRVNYLFPPELVHRLKRFTADRGANMTSVVIAVLDGYLRECGY